MSGVPDAEQLHIMMRDIVELGPDELFGRLKREVEVGMEVTRSTRSAEYPLHLHTRVSRWRYAARAFRMQQQYTRQIDEILRMFPDCNDLT